LLCRPWHDVVGGVGRAVRLLALHQALEALGFLERVDVLALAVLDHLQLERLRVGELAHDRRDVGEARRLRGAEAALAGDDLEGVAAVDRARDDRDDHALQLHVGRELRPSWSCRSACDG
jgi:hypothetical protein